VLDVTPAGWIATIGAIVSLLVVDWLVLGRRPHAVGFTEAARWSAFYVAIGVAFGVIFSLINGWDLGAQFFAGYVVEYSLSVDNLFVFVIIIGSFAVPAAQQPKTLSIGIAMALMLRAAFIVLGAALLTLFSFVFLIFGLALLATAVQLFRHRDQDPQPADNPLVNLARRAVPFSSSYDDGRIITHRDGRLMLTPLFLALLAIGSTDVLFAFDSIPAVFGVTDHAYVVFAANAFALLGLRPLFFLVSGLLDRLVYMATGLAVILAFIGVKLVLEFAHKQNHAIPQISTIASLAVITSALLATTIASVIKSRRTPGRRAHAGSLRTARQQPTAGDFEPIDDDPDSEARTSRWTDERRAR
jgi:tellurite resistance protein TerC